MYRRILVAAFFLMGVLSSGLAFAGETVVAEGDEGKALYDQLKSESNILKQIDKNFILLAPDGEETEKPTEITIKVGEYVFITNEEEKVVHNVYDQSDNSWVLKKQEPGGYAAISFGAAGVHELRCAIHPKMKITVKVVE